MRTSAAPAVLVHKHATCSIIRAMALLVLGAPCIMCTMDVQREGKCTLERLCSGQCARVQYKPPSLHSHNALH
eukprot:1150263-Pelagomonas_calceolata.AAC.3